MNKQTHELLDNVNRAVIKVRGVYSSWSKKHGIGYNEMLVLYTLRDNGFCSQKMICDSYLLPKQTVNNVIKGMVKDGRLIASPENNLGREKAYVLSKKGSEHAKPLLASLNRLEEKAVKTMNCERIQLMTKLLLEYNGVLNAALAEDGE